jgi:tetratricopeptide (TPR) repeat protein
VRPFDGKVLDTVTHETYESILAGDWGPWLNLARRTIRSERSAKKRFIENTVRYMPSEGLGVLFELVVKELHPDLEGLDFLYQAGKRRASAEQLEPLQRYLASTAEFEAGKADAHEATRLWMLAQGVYTDMGKQAEALRCTRKAFACNPSDLAARYRLACLLLESGACDEARSHLLWCLRRKPNKLAYQQRYRQAIMLAAEQPDTTASRRESPAR